jgi:hypothetical protein
VDKRKYPTLSLVLTQQNDYNGGRENLPQKEDFMSIEFTWQCEGQEPLELSTEMIQEDVIKYQMGLEYSQEEETK